MKYWISIRVHNPKYESRLLSLKVNIKTYTTDTKGKKEKAEYYKTKYSVKQC